MRILVIEDDTLIGDGLKSGLTALGFAVDWVRDGRQGQAAIDAAPYDAVVLDLGLPGIDGLDILAGWRRTGRTSARGRFTHEYGEHGLVRSLYPIGRAAVIREPVACAARRPFPHIAAKV